MKAGKTDNSGRMKTVFFAVFLAFAVFGAEPVFCAEQAEQEKPNASSGAVGDLSQLIGPDEYLGIAAGTYRSAGGILPEMMIRYYDSSGALQRETVSHIGEFMGRKYAVTGRMICWREEFLPPGNMPVFCSGTGLAWRSMTGTDRSLPTCRRTEHRELLLMQI